MNGPDYKALYSQLNERQSVLNSRRVEMELELGNLVKEIEALEQTLSDLAPLCGYVFNPSNIGNLTVTQGVLAVLDAKERMSVADIRKKMEEKGFSFASYSAPAATLHTVLRRLAEANKAMVEREGYKTFYRAVAVELEDDDIPF